MARQKERTPFGQRLSDARKAAKLTQVKLAELAGMAQGTLAELEWIGQGSSYTPMLAAACGVSAEWLAGAADASADPDWPFGQTITRAEWRLLPDQVRAEIVRAARRYVLEYRQDLAPESGKSSDSGRDPGKRAA